MAAFLPVFILAVIFAAVVALSYIKNRTREREMLIEKGVDASIFKINGTGTYTSLKWGIFLVGIAAGLLIGNILAEATSMQSEVAYFSMIFLFGGIALIIYYMIDRKHKRESVK